MQRLRGLSEKRTGTNGDRSRETILRKPNTPLSTGATVMIALDSDTEDLILIMRSNATKLSV